MNDTLPPPDWDIELQLLRDAATSAGIHASLNPEDLGISLETADQFLARMKAADAAGDELARRRRIRRRVLFASTVAAVGLLVTSVVQPWGSTPVQAATPAILDYEFASADAISQATGRAPDATFAALAKAAAGEDAGAPTSGTQHVITDSWYIELESANDETGASALIPQINETYLAPDGSVRLVTRRDDPLPEDGRGLPDNGAWDEQPTTADETQPAGSLDPDLAANLPTDPAQLREALIGQSGCPDTALSTEASSCLYDQVLFLSQTYVVSPELNEAIWKVLAQEKGFRSLGEVEDRAGRDAVGISLISDARPEYRLVLIADPETGRILGSEQILIDSVPELEIEAPAIVGFTAILDARYED